MNELVKSDPQNNMLVFGSQENFEQAMRMAKCLSQSSIVPIMYQDKEKGLSNCIIALEMANRIKMSPLMVMQNLYVVYGNVGWSSKFLIAAWNTCGKYTTIKYEYEGQQGTDNWGCRAVSTDKETGEILKSALVTIKMSKVEGWYDKKGSKWQTLPELMLQYRSAAFLVRAYAPEISMGMQTQEEIEDVVDVEYKDVTNIEKEIQANANKETIEIKIVEETLTNQEDKKEAKEKVKEAKTEIPKTENPEIVKSEMPNIFNEKEK